MNIKKIAILIPIVVAALGVKGQSGISINETSNTITSSTQAIGFANDTLKTTTIFKGANANFSIFGTGNTGLALFGTTGLFQSLNFPNDSTQVLRGNGTFGKIAQSNVVTGTGTTNYVPLYTGSSTLSNSPIAISGSNVGIGTSSPAFSLDVSGSAHVSSSLTTPHVNFYSSGVGIAIDGGNFSISSTTNNISFQSNNLNNVGSLTSTGKVLGNSLVANDSIVTPFMHSGRILPMAGDSTVMIGDSGLMVTQHRRVPRCSPETFLTNQGSFSFGSSPGVYNNFTFGLGTTTPDAAFNIANTGTNCTTSTPLMLSITSAGYASDVFSVYNTGNTYIAGQVAIATNTTTFNPNYQLDVYGTIHGYEVKVCNTTGCDFVFDSTYHLMPLDTLNEYLKTNHHLPEIASAQQMKDDGNISLGKMDMQLLQKVEELTLYVIKQQKENEQLHEEVEKLKEQMSKTIR